MNDDRISRKWLMECVDEGWIKFDTEKDKNTYVHLVRDIAPPAQPEQKKGRWIVIVKGCKLTSYKCSECGRYVADDTGYDVKKDYPFCHCGADMRGDTNE